MNLQIGQLTQISPLGWNTNESIESYSSELRKSLQGAEGRTQDQKGLMEVHTE